jgi:tetratricopeptide (TPR) repeat protein
MRMENIGLNNDVLAGGKNFHIQTQYLEPSEKVVSNIFDNGKVIFTKGIELKNGAATNEIKSQVNRLHQDVIADLELIFYISEKVKTIRHAASNNKLGMVFLTRNLYNEAMDQFKNAIELDPEFVEPYNNLGYVLLKQKLYQDAIDAFSSGIKIDGEYADLHYNLGYAYVHTQKYGEAIQEFNKAIEINGNYVAAVFHLSIIYLKSIIEEVPDLPASSIPERLEKVKHLLIDIRTQEQYSEFEYIDNILDYIDKSNFTEAIKALEKAEHELPEMLDKYLESEFYLKFILGYVERLRHAVEKHPEYADLRNNLGIGYLIQCRNLFLNALEEFREAMRINPEFKKAEKNLKLAENDGKGFLILLRAILK